MIRRITLENYMSHVHTVIEPAAGLTVLVGPNNCGKSAVAHALEMICYNSDAASFAIRHGAKEAVVTVETVDEDGTPHTVVWKRKKETATFIIDGRVIHGQGRGKTPDGLHQILKMPEVDSTTGKAFRINFGLQKEPIFLLDEPPSRAAQFFASSSDADRLMEMQRRHKQKESNARRDKDRLDTEIAKLDNQLADLSPLPELSQQLTQLEAEHHQILIKADQFAGLTRFITDLESAIRSEQLFLHRSQASKDLKRPPDLMETNALQKLVENLQISQRRDALEADRLRATQALQPLPAQRDVAALSLTIAQLQQLTKERDKQRETSAAVAELKTPPIENDPAPLARDIAQLKSAEKKANQLLNRHRRLMQLQAVPDQIDVSPLIKTIDLLENAAAKATTAQRALRRAEQNLLQLREQIQRWVDDNPKCQSCGQTINAELVISGGHDHA